MINQHSVTAVEESRFSTAFIKPLYNSYNFANVPPTIINLLAEEGRPALLPDVLGALPTRYKNVVVMFVDAFGWRFFERYHERFPFLRRFEEEGVVSKLTSQFPSTTAAHVTCIHTGLPVGESGVYEWFYYEPRLDTIIAPLLFSIAGDHERGTLRQFGVEPQELFPRETVYQTLAAHGVSSYVVQHAAYTPSPYTNVVTQGAQLVPYATLRGALNSLVDILLSRDDRTYCYFYYGQIDTAAHHHGPNSQQFEGEVEAFFDELETIFFRQVEGKLDDTLLIMIADHGQIEIDPRTTFYINRELPQLCGLMKKNRRGELLAPAGAPRDMFLHIEDALLDEAAALLRDRLGDKAEVYETRTLIEQGFFGARPPRQQLLDRIGNLVILPYRNESVWWYAEGRHEQRYYGHHGGATREEMETIFLCRAFSRS